MLSVGGQYEKIQPNVVRATRGKGSVRLVDGVINCQYRRKIGTRMFVLLMKWVQQLHSHDVDRFEMVRSVGASSACHPLLLKKRSGTTIENVV
jgi:hypothetical protein